MRRYGMLLLVLVLAVTSLLAAAAYNSATVVSAQTLKVVNTNQALLALIPQPTNQLGGKDATSYVKADGTLAIDFGESGIDKNGWPGQQPGSVYQWDKLMSIWNKSAEKLQVTVTFSGGAAEFLTVKGFNSGHNWYDNVPVYGPAQASHTFVLGADSTIPLTFIVDLPVGTTLGTNVGTMTVSAVAIP